MVSHRCPPGHGSISQVQALRLQGRESGQGRPELPKPSEILPITGVIVEMPGSGQGRKLSRKTHLSPDQLPNTDEQAPEPLFCGQWGAAEGLSTKLDDDNLQERGWGWV